MRKILPLFLFLFFVNKETRANCDPAFTATAQNATVQLHATNTASNLFHSWRSNGAGYAYGASSSLTFYAPGTYIIVHRVVDSLGACEDSTQQTVVVNFPVSCTAQFTATRDSTLWTRYIFRTTSYNTGGSIFTFMWTLDGNTLGYYNSSFSYDLTPGLHNICLTIYTTAGCTSSVCQTINVAPPPCTLTTSFTYITSSTNPKQVGFTGNPSSNDFVYNWSFGDGHTSSQQNVTHTYAQAGAYDVVLRIWDPVHSCFDTVIQNILVHGLPSDSCTASFTYTADPVISNQISFAAISNQTITSQTWWIDHWSDPYDSIVIHSNNPTYTFTDTGYYYVCLYITTNTGCTKLYCDGIYINRIDGRQAGRIPSYPNPARNDVSIRLSLNREERVSITVYNLSGYVVYKTQKQGNIGTNNITIPVQQLNSGQYFIDIQYGDQRKRSIFQKF